MIRDIARWIALGGVFLLPFLPLIVSNSLFFPFITGKNFAFRVIVEVIFAAWVILALADSKYRIRFSYILASVAAFLGVMAVANGLGEAPHKSFWSNYERMDGYVTIFHLGLYLVVAGSILHAERLWNAFWNTSIVVAIFMTLYGFCQLSGSTSCPIGQGGDFRIDGRMGNAAYLAIYMFFHVFISALLMVRAKSPIMRAMYVILSIAFTFILFQTATRGTMAALAGGIMLAAAYIALFERQNALVRKIAIAMVLGVVALGTSFYVVKDSEYVQSNTVLSRLATVYSLEQLTTRLTIWNLAIEGVKERPVLGWGQENFNYVFNQHYKANLYNQEPWFDRVHNLALDWLIAGGIVGFLAYVAILLSALYYIVIRPFTNPEEESFSVIERGVLLGLIGGYVAHNLLVFDNLISYFFFFSVLAMVHSRFSKEIPFCARMRMSDDVVKNIAVPVTAVCLVAMVYFVNIPSLNASSLLIKSFQTPDAEQRLAVFERSLKEGSFANQEIREQLVRAAQLVIQSQELPVEIKKANPKLSDQEVMTRADGIRKKYIALAESELNKQIQETPNDVRILVFQSSFYRVIGKPKEAVEILERAVELSPEKQQVLFELALAQMQMGDMVSSKEVLKNAFELETKNEQARMLYASSAIYTDDSALLNELITPEYKNAYMMNDSILRALSDKKKYAELTDLMKLRIEKNPSDLQLYVSLAYVHYQSNKVDDAVRILEDAIKMFPEFKKQGGQYIEQIKAGTIPKN